MVSVKELLFKLLDAVAQTEMHLLFSLTLVFQIRKIPNVLKIPLGILMLFFGQRMLSQVLQKL